MKLAFRKAKLNKANMQRLMLINSIIADYQQQGLVLTLRQLYYQLVSRDVIPNKQAEYTRLSHLLKEGRMSGIVDWDAIEDRLRKSQVPPSWESVSDILESCAQQFAYNRQQGQDVYLEVWVEKDALSGVLSRITEKYHVPILVCRGYSSVSAMFDAYQRFERAWREDKHVKILYIGDFDPSGEDMVRDIEQRILTFAQAFRHDNEFSFEIDKIALTLEQIRKYAPPPNPAKLSDPRAKDFVKLHGYSSWEVDALRPEVLSSLLQDKIVSDMDLTIYNRIIEDEKAAKNKLKALASDF